MRAVEEPVREIGGQQRVPLLHVLLVVGSGVRQPRRPRTSVEAEPGGPRAAVPRVDEISWVFEGGAIDAFDAFRASFADEARADLILLAVPPCGLVEASERTLVDDIRRQGRSHVRD